MDEYDDLRVFFSNSKIDLEGKFPCEMRFGRFRPKSEDSVFISPQIFSTEIELRFLFVNLDLVFAMVGEKVKNETVATFYDVYDVFDQNFGPFSTFRSD